MKWFLGIDTSDKTMVLAIVSLYNNNVRNLAKSISTTDRISNSIS